MDPSFTFVSVVYFCSLAISHVNRVSGVEENFTVEEAEAKVERLAVERATYKPHLGNKIMSRWKRRTVTKICDQEPQVKVEFCHQFLPMADLGMKFGDFLVEELNCEPKTFHIRHRPQNEETDNYTLDMYSCPNITYKDLGTDEDTTINHKYYVSNGTKYNSAIVFVQKYRDDGEGKIYPRYHIKKIIFKNLVPTQLRLHSLPVTPSPEVHSDSIEIEANAYEKARKLSEPYEKFRRTFFSVNICGLRKAHKVHLCRETIRRSYLWYAQLLFQGYDEYACKRRQIRITIPDRQDFLPDENLHRPIEKEIILLLCPRIISLMGGLIDEKHRDFVYLSSNLRSRSVFFFTRKNERGATFARKFMMDNLNTEKIVQDQRRARFMLYTSKEEREDEQRQSQLYRLKPINSFKELEKIANLVESSDSVQMPTAIPKQELLRSISDLFFGRQVQIERNEYIVDDVIISFSEIKSTKFVYSRFEIIYWSLDICQQPKTVRRKLCNTILRQDPFNYNVNLDETNIDYPCNKRMVHLRVREIENLQPMDFSIWRCPKPTSDIRNNNVHYNFFIAKCPLKNSALVLRTFHIHPDADIYPDAVVTGINRGYLAITNEEEQELIYQ